MSSIGALKHSIITVSVTMGSMCQDVIMLFISVLVVYRIVWLGGATRFGKFLALRDNQAGPKTGTTGALASTWSSSQLGKSG
jgi:hypothetical protein